MTYENTEPESAKYISDPKVYVLIGPKGMYHPNNLRVRQTKLLWGGKKKAVEQPNVLNIVKTALCFSPLNDTFLLHYMHGNPNRILVASIIQAGPIQDRSPSPPPPFSEALKARYLTIS